MTREDLEHAAIAAHADGIGWLEFCRQFSRQIVALAPDDDDGFRQWEARLLHLLVSGEASGQYAVGDDDAVDPRAIDDDVDKPHDTSTQARFPDAKQVTMFDTTVEYQ